MKFDVLDFGYVELIEHWGSEERIVEAARMSTGKGFKGWGTDESPGDEKFLEFLYRNHHSTPFEMAGFVIEVKAPIFVFREWHRHRTQSYNEMSARYIPIPDEHYVPDINRLMDGAHAQTKNRQAQGIGGKLTLAEAHDWLDELAKVYALADDLYQWGLKIGVPKELARLPMPVGRYSKMRASANLRNWIGFLKLREDENAQWEIRQFAHKVSEIVSVLFKNTWRFYKYGQSY